MAETITYDPTELPEGELSNDELLSLEVGENLAQEEQELLAGKYRDAAELEQAYLELQKKLGSNEPEEPEAEVQEKEEEKEEEVEYSEGASLIQEASTEYFQNGGQLTPETLDKFSSMSSRELVEAYMELQANNPQPQQEVEVVDLSPQEVNVIQNSVGGEQAYSQLVSWASENLPEEYINAYDSVVESGNVQAIQIAVAGLRSQYEQSVGYEGRMLTGKAASQAADVFRSQAEVVRAMNDPRYDSDPAYRQDVFDKLDRSSIQY
jgi:hypothetical protein